MTYIEFFEKEASENICSCLTRQPERVILIGDKSKLMKAHAKRYETMFSNRGQDIEFIYRAVNKNNIQDIIDTLSCIVEKYEDCVFDLTGGEDLYLVAMGIVFERYKNNHIQMHRFNIRNNTIYDCDQDGITIFEGELPPISIEENIRIYGGEVVYDHQKEGSTPGWEMTDEFKNDIRLLWDICKHNVKDWNVQMGVLAAAEQFRDAETDPLTITAPISHLNCINTKFIGHNRILDGLRASGLLTFLHIDNHSLTITYKNEQVKRCLIKAGQVLEMKVLCAALDACETDGTKTYNDVMNGVFIDWDGTIHATQDGCDTENEIDVMMMHGMVPVFVSCKNGYVEKDELYKLNTVAERFGGKYAKKVLVATALGESNYADHLLQRANDMNIRVVRGIQQMSDIELQKTMKSLWCN